MPTSDSDQFDVREYGAGGDGEGPGHRRDPDDFAATGGTVFVPAGEFVTAPLTVGDDTTLHLDAGATHRTSRLRTVRRQSRLPYRQVVRTVGKAASLESVLRGEPQ